MNEQVAQVLAESGSRLLEPQARGGGRLTGGLPRLGEELDRGALVSGRRLDTRTEESREQLLLRSRRVEARDELGRLLRARRARVEVRVHKPPER